MQQRHEGNLSKIKSNTRESIFPKGAEKGRTSCSENYSFDEQVMHVAVADAADVLAETGRVEKASVACNLGQPCNDRFEH